MNTIPAELEPLVSSKLPLAVALAKDVSTLCAAAKERPEAAPALSPASESVLATDPEVAEILVRCDWPATKPTSSEAASRSFAFPALRGIVRQALTPSPELHYDTFIKRGDRDHEKVFVPSSYASSSSSADIVVTQPTTDGGTVEVTVATVKQ